jgi:hypothetical protein
MDFGRGADDFARYLETRREIWRLDELIHREQVKSGFRLEVAAGLKRERSGLLDTMLILKENR